MIIVNKNMTHEILLQLLFYSGWCSFDFYNSINANNPSVIEATHFAHVNCIRIYSLIKCQSYTENRGKQVHVLPMCNSTDYCIF